MDGRQSRETLGHARAVAERNPAAAAFPGMKPIFLVLLLFCAQTDAEDSSDRTSIETTLDALSQPAVWKDAAALATFFTADADRAEIHRPFPGASRAARSGPAPLVRALDPADQGRFHPVGDAGGRRRRRGGHAVRLDGSAQDRAVLRYEEGGCRMEDRCRPGRSRRVISFPHVRHEAPPVFRRRDARSARVRAKRSAGNRQRLDARVRPRGNADQRARRRHARRQIQLASRPRHPLGKRSLHARRDRELLPARTSRRQDPAGRVRHHERRREDGYCKADVQKWLKSSQDAVRAAYPKADLQKEVKFFGSDTTADSVYLRILGAQPRAHGPIHRVRPNHRRRSTLVAISSSRRAGVLSSQ